MTDIVKPLTEVQIASFDLADIDQLAEVAASSYAATFGHLMEPEHLAATLRESRSAEYFEKARETNTILVAKVGGAVAGFAQFGDSINIPEVNAHEDCGPDDRELSRLYVATSIQGLGIGGKLLDSALGHEVLTEAPQVFLQVWEDNHNAIGLYKSRGFDFSRIGPTEYETGYITNARDLIMVRRQES